MIHLQKLGALVDEGFRNLEDSPRSTIELRDKGVDSEDSHGIRLFESMMNFLAGLLDFGKDE